MSAKMTYPSNNDTILPLFVAYGELKGATRVKGTITPQSDKYGKPIPHVSDYYVCGTHWLLVFSNAVEGEEYELEVRDQSDGLVGKAKKLIVVSPGVNIHYPQANFTVSTVFGCYGLSTEPSSPITTMEVKNSVNTINGSLVFQQIMGGNLYFGIAFQMVPPSGDDKYTLTVKHANGVVDSKANLTVV